MPETYITPRANQLDVLEQIEEKKKIASDTTNQSTGVGLTRVQLDAAPVQVAATTAIPTTESVMDSTGQPFNPDSCAHAYGYSAGLLVTDTATDGTSTWVKTYSYTSGNLTGETKWVKQ